MNNTGISTEALQQQLMLWAAQPFAAAGTVPTSREDDVENYYGGYDESLPYWEEQGWVPTMKSGKQRTPNMIRNELQRFLDQSNETQTAILERMGVNSNSFRRFMNPKTYKNQWSAVDNGTYWAAAKLLEAERGKKKEAAPSKKRKATTNDGVAGPVVSKKSKAELKWDVVAKMNRINSVAGVHESIVYDSCPEIVKKVSCQRACIRIFVCVLARTTFNMDPSHTHVFFGIIPSYVLTDQGLSRSRWCHQD
jgi:hypothetical protein